MGVPGDLRSWSIFGSPEEEVCCLNLQSAAAGESCNAWIRTEIIPQGLCGRDMASYLYCLL